ALAFARAARLYQMTLELLPADDRQRGPILRRLGDSLLNTGRGVEAAEAYRGAQAFTVGPEALDLQRRQVQCLLASGHIDEGMLAVKDLLAAVGLRFPKTPGRALVRALARLTWLRLRGFDFVERSEASVDPDLLARIDACQVVAQGLNILEAYPSF